MLKTSKVMLREMKTDVKGITECINHNFETKSVWDSNRGLHQEDICKNCGKIKPLDPQDNNSVEVD